MKYALKKKNFLWRWGITVLPRLTSNFWVKQSLLPQTPE
jgi:hypothetical protein